MSVSSNVSSPTRGRSKLEEKLDAMLEQRESLVADIKGATARKVASIARANDRFNEAVGTKPAELAKLDLELASFVERHHYSLTRRLGKTIRRKYGEVKFALRAIELEVPGSETPVVDFLLNRPGGKRYLVQTWKLNRRALLFAPSELLKQLRPFGIWRGKHRLITVKSPASNTTSKTLSLKRYNKR